MKKQWERKKTKRVSLEVPDEIWAILKSMKEKRNKTLTDYINGAINQRLIKEGFIEILS